MGELYDTFAQDLERVRHRFAGNPRAEMHRLFLLALEREEIAAAGYRESPMVERIGSHPLDPETRELMRHALSWIWKDEEMHAVYIRGAIFRCGGLGLRLRAIERQASGWMGGWASSVLIHTRWRDAPVSRLAARLLTALGSLAGRVPREVRRFLCWSSFHDFCRLSIEAESTAWLCWNRLADLAAQDSVLGPHLARDFRRIATDEEHHRQIFEILLGTLDENDRRVPGEDAECLNDQIGAVSPYFLPRECRGPDARRNPLGSGDRVWVIQGDRTSDKVGLFRRLLEDCALESHLRCRAGSLRMPPGELRVAIKPSFMLGYHRRDLAPITDPQLVEELCLFLADRGFTRLAIVEGRNIYDRYYGHRTVAEVARYFGIGSDRFPVVDCAEEQVPHEYARGMAQYTVGRTWKEADFRISFGKLRSHPVELALLTIGNVEWLGARCEEYLFVERQARRETAVMMLLDNFPPHFALLDAYQRVPDGLVGVMGSTAPKDVRRFYAGADALAVDLVAARHLGIKDLRPSSLLRTAAHWFGGRAGEAPVDGVDAPIEGWRGPFANEFSTLMSMLAMPAYVLASSRGALFVPEMDEEAFPLLQPEGRLMRLARAVVRRILGLHHRRQRRPS